MKSEKELNELKESVEALNKRLKELAPEELAQVTGGHEYEGAFYIDGHGHIGIFDSDETKAQGNENRPNPLNNQYGNNIDPR